MHSGSKAVVLAFLLSVAAVVDGRAQAPTTYTAYTGTDVKTPPAAPTLGPANTTITDPVFNTEILRVTDQNTSNGRSFISTDSGFHRAWNANATAIKLTGPQGDGWWMAFNPGTFRVGDGSASPKPNPVPTQYAQTWEWSAVNPDVFYVLAGNQIASYNKVTGVATNLGGPSTGEPVAYWAAVVGQDNWVCAAAGAGVQQTWSKIYCIQPNNPSSFKFIDVQAKTINGVSQPTANWPTAAGSSIIGIHGLSGGTGDRWLHVTFANQSWGGNGDAVMDLTTNTWSLLKAQNFGGDVWWAGHVSMGNGTFANGGGNQGGQDSRGVVLRNPDNLQSIIRYIGQPSPPYNGWCGAEHTSWLNSASNPGAPIIQSRYGSFSGCQFTWSAEILGLATDGSNTVYRFAHNHNANCYYGQAFAQVSNDGRWVLFSSPWDLTLPGPAGFDCSARIDTFILKLVSGDAPPPNPVLAWTQQPTQTVTGMAIAPAPAGTLLPAAAHNLTLGVTGGGCTLSPATPTTTSNATTGAWSFTGVTVTAASPPANCTVAVTDTTNNAVAVLPSNSFNVIGVQDVVTLTVSPPCTLSGPTTALVVNNAFSFPGVTVSAPTLPQTCTLTITHSDVSIPPETSNPFTVTGPTTVPILAFSQQPGTTETGQVITPNISGTLTPGSVRTLQLTINPSNCGVSGNQTTTTNASGQWVFPALTVNAVGLPASCNVTIRDTSTTDAAQSITSANFTVNAPPPPTLVFTQQPHSTQTGMTMASFWVSVVQISSTEFRMVRTGSVTLTPNPECTASFTNLTGAVDVASTATFNAVMTSGTGTHCSFTASMPGANSATSAFFDITAMPPPTLVRAVVPRGIP